MIGGILTIAAGLAACGILFVVCERLLDRDNARRDANYRALFHPADDAGAGDSQRVSEGRGFIHSGGGSK